MDLEEVDADQLSYFLLETLDPNLQPFGPHRILSADLAARTGVTAYKAMLGWQRRTI